MENIKVLHLLTSKSFSGAENMVCQIIDMFKYDKISMVYCSAKGSIEDELKKRNIEFKGVEKFSYSEIKKVVDELRPDIIHAHDIKASIIASLFTNRSIVISHIHGNHDDMKIYTIKSILYKIASKRLKHIFWVSKSALNEYKFYSSVKLKSSILYNVINISELEQKRDMDDNNYDYDVIYLGRLTYPKNPERLISVFKKVCNRLPNTKFAVIGDGVLRSNIEQLAEDMNIKSNIDFLGFKSNPLKILSESKVMAMTSRYEGTPMCALEAMSLGIPIVSTPTDGLKEVVDHNVTGYLSDDDEKIVNYICEILANPKNREVLSRNSKSRAHKINNIDNYKNTIESIYFHR